MNSEVESYIRDNCPWAKVPTNIRQHWIISQRDYDKQVVEFSIKNQLRHKGNLVRFIKKDPKIYYEELLQYSRQSLMLYPYHLSDVIVSGLRITPFNYYIAMMEGIMLQERSYDSLPNFTAADCVRLLGIGRNEYIDLMNQCRSGRKLFRRRNVRDHLPSKPAVIPIEPWWMVHLGMVTEEDVRMATVEEKTLIDDCIVDSKTRPRRAGDCDRQLLHNLYNKGLVYLEVPIDEKDYIMVPPLEGFVMNRVLGDYFETLLYKIFVSIDEQTSVGELAAVLEINLESVKNAVSLYCRLGFAKKKCSDTDTDELHPSWNRSPSLRRQGSVISVSDPLLLELDEALAEAGLAPPDPVSSADDSETALFSSPARSKRIAFLFDSTLTAFLMMGNLSPGLKNHAVTMFEVGKLSDESLDSLVAELEKISTDDSEGEAQRYFEHALVLRATIKFLRQDLSAPGLDLIRCESLQSLDSATCSRLLNKNYTLLVSMAPLSKEISAISSKNPPHLGPSVPEVNTAWFKLYLYSVTGSGPATLLLPQGTRLRKLPRVLRPYQKVLLATWGHDPAPLPLQHLVLAANDALVHSAVLIQGLGETVRIPFPLSDDGWASHPAIQTLSSKVDLKYNCGFLTMVRIIGDCTPDSLTSREAAETLANEVDGLTAIPPGPWAVLDCDFGVPLFSATTNEQVCNAICKHRLWDPDSLEKLVEAGQRLEEDFLQFVGNIQENPESFPNNSCDKRRATSLLPRRNWIFDGKELKLWNDR